MGLIREVQGVNATINKQERARRERERLAILKENYKKELESDLKAEFYNLYKKLDPENAYKIAIFQKDLIIEKIYNIISKITYVENGKKYLTYSNFDIVGDLQENYNKILAKVKNEFVIIENINKNDLLDALEKKIKRLFDLSNSKYCASIVADRYDIKIKIINDMAQNNVQQKILLDNYERILAKIKKQYNGDIKQAKMEIKNRKQNAIIAYNNKISKQLFFGSVLSTINSIIPRGFSNGKGR